MLPLWQLLLLSLLLLLRVLRDFYLVKSAKQKDVDLGPCGRHFWLQFVCLSFVVVVAVVAAWPLGRLSAAFCLPICRCCCLLYFHFNVHSLSAPSSLLLSSLSLLLSLCVLLLLSSQFLAVATGRARSNPFMLLLLPQPHHLTNHSSNLWHCCGNYCNPLPSLISNNSIILWGHYNKLTHIIKGKSAKYVYEIGTDIVYPLAHWLSLFFLQITGDTIDRDRVKLASVQQSPR